MNVKRLDTAATQAFRKVEAKVQQKIFDGPIGRALANPDGFIASGAEKLGMTAFKDAGPAPALKRPVVMIPGLTMQAASYDPLAKQLATNAANGSAAVYVVEDGKFHAGGVDGPVMSDDQVKRSKMIEIQYTNVFGAPSEKAPQLSKAFAAISKATGAPSLDVVAHSAGCTDFRLYLQSRSPAEQAATTFNETVLIGPATQGTFMGDVGAVAGAPVGVTQAGKELRRDADEVRAHNTTWDNQKSQINGQVTIVGVSGAPTVGRHGLTNGDGFMPVEDLGLPGAKTVVLRGADPTLVAHLAEVAYSGVIDEVQKRLGQ
jgi:hypothetical protein